MKNRLREVLMKFLQFSSYLLILHALLAASVLASSADAQFKSVKEVSIDLKIKTTDLQEVFKAIEEETDFKFHFLNKDIRTTQRFDLDLSGITVADLLYVISDQAQLKFRQINNNIAVSRKKRKTDNAVAIIDLVGVSGKVTDDEGEPLIGVTVIVKGTTTGTTTDIDGNYTLDVPDDAVLVFSFVGFETIEVPVGNRSTIDVTMGGATELEEVVVVAYGTANSQSYIGSAGVVSNELIENRPITNAANALQGNVAGLQSTTPSGQPGSSPTFRLRGTGSFSGTNQPLFVVDGTVYNENINNINPSDIESFTVLKDAASTALYGARAANGVILITTKTGKSGRSKVNFRYSQGVTDRAIVQYDKMNQEQYYLQMWEGYRQDLIDGGLGLDPAAAATQASQDFIPTNLGYNVYNVPANELVNAEGVFNPSASLLYDDFDWFGEVTRTGIRTDVGADISGGNEDSNYFISVGYLKEEGYLIRSDLTRYNARINVNNRLNEWLKFGLNVSATYREGTNNGANAGTSAFANPFNFARFIGPIYPVYAHDENGDFILDDRGERVFDEGGFTVQPDGTIQPRPVNAGRHVVQEFLLDDRSFESTTLSSRTFLEAEFLQNFKFRTNIGVDLRGFYDINFRNTIIGDGAPAGTSTRQQINDLTLTLNQLLTYERTFGSHFISALVGHESYQFTNKQFFANRQGQISDGNTELDNFAEPGTSGGDVDEETLESFLSRVEYEYEGKYLASASFRRDGSSRIAEAGRWGNFYSFGLGWRLDEEAFLSGVSWINILKLRGSYGEVGELRGIGFYPYQGLYGILNNAGEPGFIQSNIGNDDLQWERTVQSDVAVDFTLFNNRLSGTVEYFNRTSKDLIFDVPLAGSVGAPGGEITRNIGSFQNRGLEIQLQGDIVRTGDFTWNLNINATTYNNTIITLPDGEEIDSGTKRLREGGGNFDFFMRQYWGVDINTGDPLYKGAISYDPARDMIVGSDTLTPILSNAREDYVGKSAIPDLFGGVTNTFSYKNISLSILATYQIGGYVYDGTYAALMNPGYGSAAHVDLANSWRQPGDVTDVPRYQPSNSANIGQADRFLIDASYLNIRQVTLSYQFSKSVLDFLKLRSGSAYISGENLALFSERDGLNVTQAFSGTVSNTYLPARIFSIGLNVGL